MSESENEYGGKETSDEAKVEYKKDPVTGEMLYQDPKTKIEYAWDTEKNSWKQRGEDSNATPQYDFDGKTYLHTDANGVKHKWDLESEKWVVCEESEKSKETSKEESQKSTKESSEEESEEDENTTDEQRKERMFRKRKCQPGWTKLNYFTDPESGAQMYKDPNDGMTYEWDTKKRAWFPRINEDFLAQYQMNYGFTKDGVAEPTKPEEISPEDLAKTTETGQPIAKKAKNEKAQWFDQDSDKSTKVYVTGLPDGKSETWGEEEFTKYMSKCGVVDIDVRTNKPKVKLYRDSEGNFKGDGLCTYVKVESVQLALTIIDGASIKPGETITVEVAKFELKGEYNAKLKPKKLTKKELEKLKKKQEKLLAWEPDKLRGERSKRDKVVTIENVFDPSQFDADASLILECSNRLREKCSKLGTVRKVVVYDKHPQGICQVFFASPEEADIAISMLDGRIFAKDKIMKASTWDGKTKYKVNETEEEEKERLAKWDKFLTEEVEKESEKPADDADKK